MGWLPFPVFSFFFFSLPCHTRKDLNTPGTCLGLRLLSHSVAGGGHFHLAEWIERLSI